MHVRVPTIAEWIALGGAGLALAALLIPPGQSVADGRFRLTVEINNIASIDDGSIRFATYWSGQDADRSLDASHSNGSDFFRPALSRNGALQFDVPWTGRGGRWGGLASYKHPQYLVVEYRQSDAENASLSRKTFPIPPGRGDRSMQIELP